MPTASVRHPAVAGRFYPSRPETLARELASYLAPEAEAGTPAAGRRWVGCVVPHAGYMYSGHVAGAVYRRLPPYSTYVILGPNHFGRGFASLAIMSSGAWLTPLGEVPINETLARALMKRSPAVQEDHEAHAEEHSLEVQVPFLQYTAKNFRIVPIAFGWVEYAGLAAFGRALAEVLRETEEAVLIVASSDLNHYEPDDRTRIKDRKAIDRILALDPAGLDDVVHRERISMCGYAPTVALLAAARELAASEAELVKYATSADAGGDRAAVVGYAGILIG